MAKTLLQEVEINVGLIKGEISFGFKIDKHQSGQPGRGVFVQVVDSEPALSDGRLHEGDEIVKVMSLHCSMCDIDDHGSC